MATEVKTVVTPEEFLAHWQGHRALTRKMFEAFPEDKLFSLRVRFALIVGTVLAEAFIQ